MATKQVTPGALSGLGGGERRSMAAGKGITADWRSTLDRAYIDTHQHIRNGLGRTV